jgi:hypothetical protein
MTGGGPPYLLLGLQLLLLLRLLLQHPGLPMLLVLIDRSMLLLNGPAEILKEREASPSLADLGF